MILAKNSETSPSIVDRKFCNNVTFPARLLTSFPLLSCMTTQMGSALNNLGSATLSFALMSSDLSICSHNDVTMSSMENSDSSKHSSQSLTCEGLVTEILTGPLLHSWIMSLFSQLINFQIKHGMFLT